VLYRREQDSPQVMLWSMLRTPVFSTVHIVGIKLLSFEAGRVKTEVMSPLESF